MWQITLKFSNIAFLFFYQKTTNVVDIGVFLEENTRTL